MQQLSGRPSDAKVFATTTLTFDCLYHLTEWSCSPLSGYYQAQAHNTMGVTRGNVVLKLGNVFPDCFRGSVWPHSTGSSSFPGEVKITLKVKNTLNT